MVTQLRDLRTGEWGVKQWGLQSDLLLTPNSWARTEVQALLVEARRLDSTGYGVELVVRVGGVTLRRSLGPTPYVESDGQEVAVWLDSARSVLLGARAVADAELALL